MTFKQRGGDSGWWKLTFPEAIHIVPAGEESKHEASEVCDCDPRVDFEQGKPLIVHNAFDGREASEMTANRQRFAA